MGCLFIKHKFRLRANAERKTHDIPGRQMHVVGARDEPTDWMLEKIKRAVARMNIEQWEGTIAVRLALASNRMADGSKSIHLPSESCDSKT